MIFHVSSRVYNGTLEQHMPEVVDLMDEERTCQIALQMRTKRRIRCPKVRKNTPKTAFVHKQIWPSF